MRVGQWDVNAGLLYEKAISSAEPCEAELDTLFDCLGKNDYDHSKCTGYLARLEVCAEGSHRATQKQAQTMKSITYQIARLTRKLNK
jgi:hypothetical protein